MHSTYAYTKAIDLANQNQLIYTPLHKATLTGTYQIGNLEIFFPVALQWKNLYFF